MSGRALNAYIVAGPGSDHECTTLEEAMEKRRLGMWVMIREASMIRNLVDLLPMLRDHGTENCMFVTDDREAQTLLDEGHMNSMVRTAVAHGLNAGDAVKLASLNVARWHGLAHLGAVAPGYAADLQVVPDLVSFMPEMVLHGGKVVAADGVALPFQSPAVPPDVTGSVRIGAIADDALRAARRGETAIHVVGLIPDQVVTRAEVIEPLVRDGEIVADPERDLAKLAVVERHHASGAVGVGFVRGFGLREGAFAATVAHDAHNVIVAGANDADMLLAARRLEEIGGGLVVVRAGEVRGELPLEIAGLMSTRDARAVARRHRRAGSVSAGDGRHSRDAVHVPRLSRAFRYSGDARHRSGHRGCALVRDRAAGRLMTSVLFRNCFHVATMDDAGTEVRGVSIVVDNGWIMSIGDEPSDRDFDEIVDCSRSIVAAWTRQRTSSPVPVADARISAGGRSLALSLAAGALSDLGGARRRDDLRLDSGRSGGTGAFGVHHQRRPSLRFPSRQRALH